MTTKKIVPFVFILALLAINACSSSSGGGSTRPTEVNVVVPPNSTVVVPSESKQVSPSESKQVSP
ncbi:MAG: hypothetical protein ABSB19_13775 [Methylomonas sp.]